MSIYGFDIPHDKGEPCRDLIGVQIPYPPSKIKSLWIPDVTRALGEHGVQCGIIRQMGPLAFQYKDADGLSRQKASIGDWVLIRWGAGTMFQSGKGLLNAIGGWRYLSTFQDVIKVIPAEFMPDPDTLEWSDEGTVDFEAAGTPAPVDPYAETVRERTTYAGNAPNADEVFPPKRMRPDGSRF